MALCLFYCLYRRIYGLYSVSYLHNIIKILVLCELHCLLLLLLLSRSRSPAPHGSSTWCWKHGSKRRYIFVGIDKKTYQCHETVMKLLLHWGSRKPSPHHESDLWRLGREWLGYKRTYIFKLPHYYKDQPKTQTLPFI